MSQRPPKKNRSNKNSPRKNRSSQQQPQQQAAMSQPSSTTPPRSARTQAAEGRTTTGTGSAPSADRRQSRREAAIRKQQQKKQLQIIIGGIAVAIVVAVVLILVNRPSNEAADIDYDGLAFAQPPIAAAAATPTAGEPLAYQGGVLGDPNAPVTFIVYADYQCHFCLQFHETTYPQILDDFVRDGQVKIEFREFPALGQGELTDDNNESVQAAEAAMCAAEQDSYLEFHDKLYANFNGVNAGSFSNDRLRQFADDLGLDTDAFNECLDSGRYEPAVIQAKEEGQALNINATPMFIIDNGNGEPNVVQQTSSGYDLLKRQIQTAIDTAQ